MNKIVVPVSYMGSGSSAITDLLSEFDGYIAPMGSSELMFMHYPNGVFDLEDKLLFANNALRSDEAIRSFEKAMAELNDTKFWWAGNYQKSVSPRFYQYVKEYTSSLIQYEIDAFWYMQEKPTLNILIKKLWGQMLKLVSLGKVNLKRPLRYQNMKLSFVEDEEFYKCTSEFMYKIFNDMGLQKYNLILDQLFTPFDVHRYSRYFGEDIVCFVVDRDPRDVFLLNKYVWKPADTPVPFPTDAEDFVRYYISIRKMEQVSDSEHIHHIHFEDLIYNYDDTLKYIKNILEIAEGRQKKQKCYFNPDKSINNTQLFSLDTHRDEIMIIEQGLGEYLYKFPYKRIPNIEGAF